MIMNPMTWDSYYTQIVFKIGGVLSCVGSGYIIQDVLRNPDKRTKSIYHRIMVGLSTMDILSSFMWFIGSWAMPKDSWRLWPAGTVATCDAAAFFGMIGWLASPLYNCSLATYYLLQLKYNWTDRKIKRIEKWFHIVPCSIALTFSITALSNKMLGPNGGYCGLSPGYPWGCDQRNMECIRGNINREWYYWFVFFLITLFAIAYVSIVMFIVYKDVRNIEQKALKYSFIARFHDENTKKTRKRSRRVMIQGILYSTTMVLLWLAAAVFMAYAKIYERERSVVLSIFWATVIPLQGLFNFFIYLIPFFRHTLKRGRLTRQSIINNRKDNNQDSTHLRRSLPIESLLEEEEEEKLDCNNLIECRY
jgi:hypothetical protein